ncbi:MAG: hypothetical protein ACLS4Z_03465 [Christensenellaceae bacterium]
MEALGMVRREALWRRSAADAMKGGNVVLIGSERSAAVGERDGAQNVGAVKAAVKRAARRRPLGK